MAFLETLGTVLSLANSAKSLFSGSDEKPEWKSMRDQVNWNAEAARVMPTAQVEGLRRAGLNPMLAVGHGISSPPAVTSSPGAETQASTARQMASNQAGVMAATIQNLESSSAKNLAEADLAKAKVITEGKMPENIGQLTATSAQLAKAHETMAALNRQLEVTEGWNTKQQITKHYLTKLEFELGQVNLPKLRKAEVDKAIADARSATTKAEVDKALLMLERQVGIGAESVGAIAGAVSSASGLKRAIDANKPRTTTRSSTRTRRGGTEWFDETARSK